MLHGEQFKVNKVLYGRPFTVKEDSKHQKVAIEEEVKEEAQCDPLFDSVELIYYKVRLKSEPVLMAR